MSDSSYTPTARRYRHDGWTPQRQTAFLHALAATACVTEAAKAVGMSTQSAYRLRADLHAVYFRAAWEQCLDMGIDRLADAALGRAMHGVAQPIFYRGQQVGERRRYDEKMAMFLLRYRRPERYGAALDRTVATSRPDAAARRLDVCLRAIEGEEWDAILADGERPGPADDAFPRLEPPEPDPAPPDPEPAAAAASTAAAKPDEAEDPYHDDYLAMDARGERLTREEVGQELEVIMARTKAFMAFAAAEIAAGRPAPAPPWSGPPLVDGLEWYRRPESDPARYVASPSSPSSPSAPPPAAHQPPVAAINSGRSSGPPPSRSENGRAAPRVRFRSIPVRR